MINYAKTLLVTQPCYTKDFPFFAFYFPQMCSRNSIEESTKTDIVKTDYCHPPSKDSEHSIVELDTLLFPRILLSVFLYKISLPDISTSIKKSIQIFPPRYTFKKFSIIGFAICTTVFVLACITC